jgi:DNA-directed RNA polymerase subunit H (RpoH/RPB5)
MEGTLLKLGKIRNTCNSEHSQILLSVSKTCKEMLTDRGHTNVRVHADAVDRMTNGRAVIEANDPDIVVFFHNEHRISVKSLRGWLNSSAENIVVVSIEGPTPFTKREAASLESRIEFFTFRELVVNVTRHHLVPMHRLFEGALPFSVKSEEDWPKIDANDIVVRYYKFPVDGIIEIRRSFGNPEVYKYYRRVCVL